jgi:hypothetical protein
MTYLDLVTSHIRRNGGDDALVSAVEDYLKNGHPHEEPPWSREFDEICQAAVTYANDKPERLHSTNGLPLKLRLNIRRRRSTVAIDNP